LQKSALQFSQLRCTALVSVVGAPCDSAHQRVTYLLQPSSGSAKATKLYPCLTPLIYHVSHQHIQGGLQIRTKRLGSTCYATPQLQYAQRIFVRTQGINCLANLHNCMVELAANVSLLRSAHLTASSVMITAYAQKRVNEAALMQCQHFAFNAP
jgi:hypothetical protein